MSDKHPIIRTLENNDEAYICWKDTGTTNATVFHIDAHLDYRNDNSGLHIGNYLKIAVEEHLAETIYWIVPGTAHQFFNEIKDIKLKLRSAGITGKISQSKSGLRTKINQTTLIVCTLEILPKNFPDPYIIDIDLDFLFFSSCLSADRTKDIGKRTPWMNPEEFAGIIKPYLKNSMMTTLCYSTIGGWTPMKYRHFGDQILELLGVQDKSIRQNIIAGNFFVSFWKHFRNNNLKQAKQYYQSAVSLNPRYRSFFMTDGPLFLLKGDLNRARTEFLRLQKLDSHNMYSLFGLGLVELLSGNMEEARDTMQRARSVTSNKDVMLFLIYIQSRLGEHEMVKKLLQEYGENTFPEKPMPQNVLTGILSEISAKLEKEQQRKNIGHMYLYPNPHAVTVWEKLVKYSPNNIGNWTEEPEYNRHTAAAIELDLMEKMINLYFENTEDYGGYITSGATEGNIFSAWMGRKYLERTRKKSPIVLLANDLTHYSVSKAADIIGVAIQHIPINTGKWNTDVDNLIKIITRLNKEGVSKFLIPLTLGYTVGGTNDSIRETVQRLRELQERIDIEYFLWIDAALSGFTIPFLKRDYTSFFPREINTVVVDFHKVLGVPMPAGFILYQKKLSGFIKSSVPYLSVSDGTLLGSRNGVTSIAAWMSIHQLGFTKITQLLLKEVKRKQSVLDEIKKEFPKVRIITDTDSLHAAILVDEELPQPFCQTYGLHLRQYRIHNKGYLVYPLFFLPEWH